MKQASTLLAISILLFSSGCALVAPTRPYTPPIKGPVAELVIQSKSIASGVLYTFDDGRACTGASILSERKIVPGTFFGAFEDIKKIRSDVPASLWFSTGGPYTCDVLTSFQPKPDAKYLVIVDAKYPRCSMLLLDISNNINPKVERRIVPRTLNPNHAVQAHYCAAANVDVELKKPQKLQLTNLEMSDFELLLPKP